MSQQLSKDISSLFDAYQVNDPKYKELSEKERYYKTKQKWQALKSLSCPASSGLENEQAEQTQTAIDSVKGQ